MTGRRTGTVGGYSVAAARRSLLLLAAIAVVLAAPASARAVTVGAPLNLPANQAEGCEHVVFPSLRPVIGVPPSCTFFGLDLAGGWSSQTPRGQWTITRARVRTGPRVGPMVFTVVRAMRSQAGSPPAGIICCSAPFESQPFVPAPNTINEIAVNLPAVNTVQMIGNEPVEVVDYLGVSLLDPGSSVPFHVAGGSSASASFIAPAMRAGGERLSDGALPGTTVLVNGEFEPAPATAVPPGTVAFRLLPGVRLLRGGTRARLGATVPGPGLLRALAVSGAGAASASRRQGKRKARRPALLVPARRRVRQAGRAGIAVNLTQVGKRRLAKRGRLTVRVRVVFRPDRGRPMRAQRAVTFRKR